MQNEIDRPKVRELKAFDRTKADAFEMLFHTLCGECIANDGIPFLAKGDDTTIGSISLVATAGVSKFG
jgi:hypothetical protein